MKKSFVEKLSGNEKDQINLFRQVILASDPEVIETVDKIMTVHNTLNYMQDGVFKYGLAKTDNHYSLHSMVMYAYPELADWLKSKKLKIKILKGWEEKNETIDFPLVKVTNKRVYFDGFTFERVGENELNIFVVLENNGVKTEQKFSYSRIRT